MAFLMGIDVGTQSLRCCLFDLQGRTVARATAAYPTEYLGRRRVEQDPADWRRALHSTVRAVLRRSNVDASEVVALSYACTSCTVVILDAAGNPLRPAIMWLDERAWQEAERVTRTAHPALKYTGGRESPQWMIPKALWLAKHEPEVYRRTRWIVEQTDLLTFELTGRWTVSRSHAAAKWHYALPLGGWPVDLLEGLGIKDLLDRWPTEVLAVGTPVGFVTPEFAAATGLSTATLVVQGGVDSHAGMVGVGAIRAGDLGMIIGTSTCHMAQSEEPVFADVWGPYPSAVADNTYTLGGGQSTTGSILQWLRAIAGRPEADLNEIEAEAEKLPPGSDGLIALDFFQGNRTPFKDPLARGALWGMDLHHGFTHIYRAFLEAVAYGSRAIVENLEQHGYRVERIIAGGGGARSRLWMQIHADVCKRPVYLCSSEEPTALGAAIWAGLGAGIFSDYDDAVKRMVRKDLVMRPDAGAGEEYDFYYDIYVQTYRRLGPLMHRVALRQEEQGKEHPR